jgi:predicted nucleic acid-binding protein
MPDSPLLLDACVAINLVAAGPIEEIALAIGRTFLLSQQAAAEVGYLRESADGEIVVSAVDLRQHVRPGAFEFVELTTEEISLYVGLARVVDDGEASTIAVALHRGLIVATDDRKARRVCRERGLAEPVGTIELVRAYCEASALDSAAIGQLLSRIRTRASFQPPRNDPELKWWIDNDSGDSAGAAMFKRDPGIKSL